MEYTIIISRPPYLRKPGENKIGVFYVNGETVHEAIRTSQYLYCEQDSEDDRYPVDPSDYEFIVAFLGSIPPFKRS